MSESLRNFAAHLDPNGSMAERLGNGLQNRVQQFESAWDLTKRKSDSAESDVLFTF